MGVDGVGLALRREEGEMVRESSLMVECRIFGFKSGWQAVMGWSQMLSRMLLDYFGEEGPGEGGKESITQFIEGSEKGRALSRLFRESSTSHWFIVGLSSR